jgi:hypothetical protein
MNALVDDLCVTAPVMNSQPPLSQRENDANPMKCKRLQGLLTNSMLLLMLKKHPKRSINCEQELIQNICLTKTVQSHGFPLHSGSSQRPQVCYVAQMLLPVI